VYDFTLNEQIRNSRHCEYSVPVTKQVPGFERVCNVPAKLLEHVSPFLPYHPSRFLSLFFAIFSCPFLGGTPVNPATSLGPHPSSILGYSGPEKQHLEAR